MESREIDPGLGNQCRQSCNEIHRLEGHLRGAIPVGRLQGIEHLAGGAQRKAGNCNRCHRKQANRSSGDKAKAPGWTSEKSQLCRFEVIARSADFEKKSVLDLGCGYGELFELLDSIYRIQS